MSEQVLTGSVDLDKLEVHPAAEIFPLLEGAEFEALVEDIRSNGLQNPIQLDPEGRMLLDGRNRLRACRKAGVEPRFERWRGKGAALEAVISLNVHRRHLNESQRALVAARLKEQFSAEAAQRRGIRQDKVVNLPPGLSLKARDQAAAMLNISPSLVQHGVRVLKSGDLEVIRAVESGKLAISAAAKRLNRRQTTAPAAKGFRVFYIDPPWTGPLPKQLPPVAPEGALLFLWAPAAKLAEALRAIERWGFRYQNCLAWTHGDAIVQRDLLLIGGRRLVLAELGDARQTRPDRDRIYETIEQLCPPGPKAQLFAAPREGWEAPLLQPRR